MEDKNTNNSKSNIFCYFFCKSFKNILIFIIILDSISIICNALYLTITQLEFIHKFIFFLNFASQCLAIIILEFAIVILLFTKHISENSKKDLITSTIFSFVMLILSPIIFILNIVLALYSVAYLHVTNYPKYTERDEEYIEKQPEKFGEVSGGQYAIAIICPCIVTVSQMVCLFFNIALYYKNNYLTEDLFRQKDSSRTKAVKTNKEEVKSKESNKKTNRNLEEMKVFDKLNLNIIDPTTNLDYSNKKKVNTTEGEVL